MGRLAAFAPICLMPPIRRYGYGSGRTTALVCPAAIVLRGSTTEGRRSMAAFRSSATCSMAVVRQRACLTRQLERSDGGAANGPAILAGREMVMKGSGEEVSAQACQTTSRSSISCGQGPTAAGQVSCRMRPHSSMAAPKAAASTVKGPAGAGRSR